MLSDAYSLYDSGQINDARKIFEERARTSDDIYTKQDHLFNAASCLAASGEYGKALEAFSQLSSEKSLDVLYNIALCNYKLSSYDVALKQITELINICREKYPELFISRDPKLLIQNEIMNQLQNSCIIEGLNLKSAILFKISENSRESLSCLNDLPTITSDEQLDCVTLHNQAIYECDINLYSSISKLNHLVGLATSQDSQMAPLVPSETFKNLVLLCLSDEDSEIFSEVMKGNESCFRKYLSKNWFRFLTIYLDQSSTLEELIYRKLDAYLDKVLEQMRASDKLEKLDLFELATFITAQESRILWNNDQYHSLEKLFAKVKSQLENSSVYLNQNIAHNLFMMDTRYEESVELYEKLLPNSDEENFNEVDSMILGNLCVSYVLTGRNGEAEALIKDVETDETAVDNELMSFGGNKTTDFSNENRQKPSNLSIINMIIGTLYCVKFNYEFGLSRMFKTLMPLEHKLNATLWFYVKRCILSLVDCHCKQMICIKDDLFQQVVSFLIQCEKYGTLIEAFETKINTSNDLNGQEVYSFLGRNSVTYEARYLRSIILTIVHD